MPKVRDTRKQKAAELLRRVTEGPSFSRNFDGSELTVERITAQYRLWASSWVVPVVKELVPELREKRER